MANKNQAIANQAFKKNKDLDKIYVADGFVFSTENAANLHKHSSGKKGIKVVSFERKEAVEKTEKKTAPAKPVKLDKLKLDELKAVATKENIRFEDNATKAQLIEAITTARKPKETK